MIVHTLHIFNKHGDCLYYRDWNRTVKGGGTKENNKLLFGYLFSLKALVARMSPKKGGGFYACSTNTFKMNYFETPSGHRFVLSTDLSAGDMREPLRKIYSDIFVECLVKNPLWRPGEEITNALFEEKLQKFIASI